MTLDENMFRVALAVYYNDTGTVEDGMRKAIDAYLAEMLKPGQVQTLEAIPQRDYRKELWLGVATAVARSEGARDRAAPGAWANCALADFDKTFPAEPTNG